ncbi:MAG TPA: protein-glutamate O-methyltransferase CheR [Terracidiphilus sp.]|nr:protein-glutamate O-methyltransferase CheR [Terracidiphilus sp.]
MSATPIHESVDFALLRRVVHARSHNVLDPSRDYVFEARLAQVIRGAGMRSLAELAAHLRHRRDPDLECAVADAMTINETSFFRDGRPFDVLRKEIVPELIEARRDARCLRMWSAACSTGQEAYSLAMLMREHFPSLANWKVQIEGTDFSREVIGRAQAGRYRRCEISRGLPSRLLARYFEKQGEDWEVKPEIRAVCRFQWANLASSPLPVRGPFDVILLRNVMLYFSRETRSSVLAQAHRLLAKDGTLILGSSEQPVDGSQWTAVFSGGTSYFRRS